VYLDYTELRKLRPLGFIRKMRNLRATTLLLPVEDELSRCILPLLRGIAAIADTQSVAIVHPDLRAERVRRSSAFGAMAGLTRASVAAARDMAYCARELAASGFRPAGTERNETTFRGRIRSSLARKEDFTLLCDAQTSGGLLIAVSSEREQLLVDRFRESGLFYAKIGSITDDRVVVALLP